MKTIFVVMVSSVALMAGCLGDDGDGEGAGGRAPDGLSAAPGPVMACVKVESTFGCGDTRTTTRCETVYSKEQCRSSRTSPVYLDGCSFYSSTNAFTYEMTCEEWEREGND